MEDCGGFSDCEELSGGFFTFKSLTNLDKKNYFLKTTPNYDTKNINTLDIRIDYML